MGEREGADYQHQMREFLEKHRDFTLEEALREFSKSLRQQLDDTYEHNVAAIKDYFNQEVQLKAVHPVTFDELTSLKETQ